MEFFLLALPLLAIAGWVWKSRKYDERTLWPFDTWLGTYELSSSPFERSGMATAFLAQSINLAWTMGAINADQRAIITAHLKRQRTTLTVGLWLEVMLPCVLEVAGKGSVARADARLVGALMLLVWMTPPDQAARDLQQFLSKL